MGIIKVCFSNSRGDKTKGCEKAPNHIISLLKEIGNNEKGQIIEFDRLDFEEIHTDPENIEESNYTIYESSKEVFEKNFKSIFLGGDHSITYPIVKAFSKIENNPLLVVFDAHPDCFDYKGDPKSREWLRKLIDDGFDPSNVILISTRNVFEEEVNFLKEKKMIIIKMDLLQEDLAGVCDLVMERARKAGSFYISIDIDAVDPGFAPATTNLEPGGISSRNIIYFIKRLMLLKNFKGADIVEINPDIDINNMTVKLGAKLLAEMI